jgi:hypothetical protein
MRFRIAKPFNDRDYIFELARRENRNAPPPRNVNPISTQLGESLG